MDVSAVFSKLFCSLILLWLSISSSEFITEGFFFFFPSVYVVMSTLTRGHSVHTKIEGIRISVDTETFVPIINLYFENMRDTV